MKKIIYTTILLTIVSCSQESEAEKLNNQINKDFGKAQEQIDYINNQIERSLKRSNEYTDAGMIKEAQQEGRIIDSLQIEMDLVLKEL
jgi:hypothetical protein